MRFYNAIGGKLVVDNDPRADLLEEAKSYVLKDRNSSYGDPEDNFARIAGVWNAMGITVNGNAVTSADVALMMVGMKVARLTHNPNHKDSWVDIAGYAACGWDVVHRATRTSADPIRREDKV